MSSTFSAWARIMLGLGLVAEGVSFLKRQKDGAAPPNGGRTPALLGLGRAGAGPEARAMAAAGGVITSSRLVSVGNIDQRVSHIVDFIRKGSLKPVIREKALAVLSRKCGPDGERIHCIKEKDSTAEAIALFKAVKDPNSELSVRYTRDHVEVDQFTAADKTLKLGAEDCDGMCIFLGAMLRTTGFPLRVRAIATQDPATGKTGWSHVYLRVGLPPMAPTRWMALDLSVDHPAGWEVPGAEQVASTGRESDIVKAVRDWDV